MNLMMITLLTVGSAVGQVPAAKHASTSAEEYYEDCYEDGGHMGISEHLRAKRAIHNTSPQTCYDPRFGCYHGNGRHMHRYPAFHGTYYRQAYNYRNYFDYPWHAGLHEPTSLFSYNVGEDQPEPPAAMTAPPTPPQARRPQPATRPQASTPAKSVVSQSAYMAPAPASRRVGAATPSTVKPTVGTDSQSSRRLNGSSGPTR